ncbi:MAG: nucleotidyl transferase AbiEii/AbiGii toxin family protein [Actinomycetota bacterium]|nr:nucleotidyl transferase AbiEii/AbiGii toxin family protein [Actinomycetota bacterium]
MSRAPEFEPSALVRRLLEAGVDFVVVGGVAVNLQAQARFTDDLDICYAHDQANLDALGSVLVDLGATLRGIDEDVPFVPDGRTLRGTQILCLSTSLGEIDLLVDPNGAPPYAKLRARSDVLGMGDVEVRVASKDDLIAMKRAAGRPIDVTDVESLLTAKRRLGRRRKRPA